MTGDLEAPHPIDGVGRRYAEVAVAAGAGGATGRIPSGPTADPGTFTYAVPPHLSDRLVVGQIVQVPFGRRQVEGIVVRLRADSPVDRTREIASIVDERSVMPSGAPALARWMSGHYLAPFHACLRAMLAPGSVARLETVYRRTARPLGTAPLPRECLAVIGAFGRQRRLPLEAIRARSGLRDPVPAVAQLVADGFLTEATRRTAPLHRTAVRRRVRLADAGAGIDVHPSLARSSRGRTVVEHLSRIGGAEELSELRSATGASQDVIRRLVASGLLIVEEERADDEASSGPQPIGPEPVLSQDQAAAWERIRPVLDGPRNEPGGRVVLLHGVTGSGKTELYLRSIRHVMESGRQAIVLVPEIALTPQTVGRFAERFPGRVGLWHSEMPAAERHDTWRRAQHGALDVIVGSRSAVFAPLPALGLVVVDEEHADSYKQPASPRYHARDVAVQRAILDGAAVILGTATPSTETYFEAVRGEYRLVELPRRVASRAATDGAPGSPIVEWVDLPTVSIVDMRAELRSGNTSMFSRTLQEALRNALDRGEQSILFLNRRGTATFVLCRDCGHVQSCPRCRLPLVYHGAGHDLACHHCRHREPPPIMCPQCGSARIRYFGAGTQKVAEAAAELLPGARLLRWDADTTVGRGAHDRILDEFASGRADVLVGTQMIAKGLDLPRVTLVGVVSADTSLHLPDFRAGERTFQLLAQVAGRAGRSALGGTVVFQTYRPEAAAIRYAANHDYAGFYAEEIEFRRESGYPPYRRLVRLEYQTQSGDRAAERATSEVASILRARVESLGLDRTDIVGPAPSFFSRTRGRARWHLVVKAADPYPLLDGVELGAGFRIDVDPVDLL